MPPNSPAPISYAGTFERSLDVKNRVTIPAGWINGGPGDFHAIPSHAGDCLMVMPPEEFNSWEDRFKQSGLPADIQRKAIRHFYSQARAVSADSQGRVLLPDDQCESLQLKGEVVLVGGRSQGMEGRYGLGHPDREESWKGVRHGRGLAASAVLGKQSGQ